MVQIRLKLLGGIHVAHADGTEISVAARKGQALIAYLALNQDQRHAREELATLLWGDRFDEQARHSLRQSVLALRKVLADENASILQSSGEFLALSTEAVEVDALEFQRLTLEGSQASLERAATLYTGDLLAGLHAQSESFDEWLSVARVRYRDIAIDAHARLMRCQVNSGDIEAAVGTAQRLLDIDPSNEDAHRSLMSFYDASGKRAAALRQYRTYVDVLRREFDAEPDPAMARLHSEIHARDQRDDRVPARDAARWSAQISAAQEEASDEVQPAQSDAAGESPIASLHPRGRTRARVYWAAGGVVLTLLTAVIVIAATFWRIPELAPAPIGAYVRGVKEAIAPHPLSIAVLPLESHGDPDVEEFADALSEGITSALSISSEMVVISRSSVRGYGDNPATIQDVAKELNVRYILEGGVRKWGDQIGIEIGLIDALEGQHRIWSESYRRQAGDFISLQQDITFEIITSLEIRLTEGETERINRAHGTRYLEAWLAAAQGEKHLRRLSERDMAIAQAYYERAIAIDTDYPGAWDGLGWIYLISARFGWAASREEMIRKAKDMAERALALDRERPRTFSLLGSISLLTGDFRQAVKLGEKAVSLGPNDADAAALLAVTLTYTGEPNRALALLGRSIRLRPHPPQWYSWMLGRAYRLAGRPEQAVAVLADAQTATTASFIPLVELAAAYSEMGEPGLAKETGAEIVRRFPEFNIRAWIAMPPYGDLAVKEREVDALRAAGLPE